MILLFSSGDVRTLSLQTLLIWPSGRHVLGSDSTFITHKNICALQGLDSILSRNEKTLYQKDQRKPLRCAECPSISVFLILTVTLELEDGSWDREHHFSQLFVTEHTSKICTLVEPRILDFQALKCFPNQSFCPATGFVLSPRRVAMLSSCNNAHLSFQQH